MINLAGNVDADKHIREELYLAGITCVPVQTDGEVHCTVAGRLGEWFFERAWYYYVASCSGPGLPYYAAVELHEMRYPLSDEKYKILGQSIRVNGHCGCLHPRDFVYPTLNEIEVEFVGARIKFPDVDFSSKRVFDKASTRELNGIKYVRLYHIDTQVGLNEFAKAIT